MKISADTTLFFVIPVSSVANTTCLLFCFEFVHPRCVCNNEVEYNVGQNTTSFLARYGFGVNTLRTGDANLRF